jgi:hypothetical protein
LALSSRFHAPGTIVGLHDSDMPYPQESVHMAAISRNVPFSMAPISWQLIKKRMPQ